MTAVVSLSTIALVVFGIAVVVTAFVSFMLLYHWVRYGVGMFSTFVVIIFYGVGTLMLLLSAYGLATSI